MAEKPITLVDKTAHEVLAEHMTNVSSITRRVMQAAMDEHARAVHNPLPQQGVMYEVLSSIDHAVGEIEAVLARLKSVRDDLSLAWGDVT